MTILSTDIRLLASLRMTDRSDGGGAMSSTALADGVDNNVFPDVSAVDRAWGRLSMRQVYPAVLANNTDVLLGAQLLLDVMPADANVGAFLLGAAGVGETRSAAVERLQREHWEPVLITGGTLTWGAGSTTLVATGGLPIQPGSVIYSETASGVFSQPVLIVSAVESPTGTFTVTFAGDRPSSPYSTQARLGAPSSQAPWLASTRPVTGTLAAGAMYCDADTLLVPVVPVQATVGATPGSSTQIGIDPSKVLPAGRACAFRGGQTAVVHHTDETTPAVATAGGTINCGRTALASVRMFGNDNAEITSGFTVNLATGIVSVVNVTGWSQPVRARHRIEEVVGISRIGYPEVRGGVSSYSGGSLTTDPFVLSSGLVMYCGRPNVGEIKVYSKTGQDITTIRTDIGGGYTASVFQLDLAAGTAYVSLGNGASALIASHSPVTLVSRGTSSNIVTPSAPQATLNRITFNRTLTRAFPAGSKVSSTLGLGDLQATVGDDFSQSTWADVWSDTRIGAAISAQYDQVAAPIVVNNRGATTDRWALIFTTASTFRVVSEALGQITTGSINSVCAPVNPATGQPYWTLSDMGWGLGWSAGNVVRFNTTGANFPAWVCRSVLPSAPSASADYLTLAVRGDINV